MKTTMTADLTAKHKFHYVYYSYEEWGRGYIGKRSCACLPEDDTKYMGSFSDKTFKPSCKIILDVFATSEEALAAEALLHDAYNVSSRPLFANKAKQTSRWFNTEGVPKSEEHKEKIRQSNLGRKRTAESRKRMSLSKMGNTYNLGVKRGPSPMKGVARGKMTTEQRVSVFLRSKRKKLRIEVTNPSGISMCPLNIKLFCEDHGMTDTHLRAVARGKRKTCKGWTAKLCKDNDD
jgi:hypothetical protein